MTFCIRKAGRLISKHMLEHNPENYVHALRIPSVHTAVTHSHIMWEWACMWALHPIDKRPTCIFSSCHYHRVLYRLILLLQSLSIDHWSIRKHSIQPTWPCTTACSCVLSVSWREVSTCISHIHLNNNSGIKSSVCVRLAKKEILLE